MPCVAVPAFEETNTALRGVAQLVAHLVWDQGVAGSNPVTPTRISQGSPLGDSFIFCVFFAFNYVDKI